MTTPSRLTIDLLALDLTTCDRCTGTEQALDIALAAAAPALDLLGVALQVNKTVVRSADQAARLGLKSSPTIRVAGRDIGGPLAESLCGDCGDLCGADTVCRVWHWQGQEYTVAPPALILAAVLREAAGFGEGDSEQTLPGNLQRFFAARGEAADDTVDDASCCAPGCCTTNEKADAACCAPGCCTTNERAVAACVC